MSIPLTPTTPSLTELDGWASQQSSGAGWVPSRIGQYESDYGTITWAQSIDGRITTSDPMGNPVGYHYNSVGAEPSTRLMTTQILSAIGGVGAWSTLGSIGKTIVSTAFGGAAVVSAYNTETFARASQQAFEYGDRRAGTDYLMNAVGSAVSTVGFTTAASMAMPKTTGKTVVAPSATHPSTTVVDTGFYRETSGTGVIDTGVYPEVAGSGVLDTGVYPEVITPPAAAPRSSGYWWSGRYRTSASQPGAYVGSGGLVFPTRRNSGLAGMALTGAQEAFTRLRLLEGHPVETVRGQAGEAGLTVLENNGRLAQKSAEKAVQRGVDWYNTRQSNVGQR